MTENMKTETEKNKGENPQESNEPDLRKLGEEGMSILTVRGEISRKLRNEIMDRFDIRELKNQGRYFKGKAYSKDGQRFYELLIDKQTNNMQVVSQSRMA